MPQGPGVTTKGMLKRVFALKARESLHSLLTVSLPTEDFMSEQAAIDQAYQGALQGIINVFFQMYTDAKENA